MEHSLIAPLNHILRYLLRSMKAYVYTHTQIQYRIFMILFFMIDIDGKESTGQQTSYATTLQWNIIQWFKKSYAVSGCGKLWMSLRSIFLSKDYEVTYCILQTCNSQKQMSTVTDNCFQRMGKSSDEAHCCLRPVNLSSVMPH